MEQIGRLVRPRSQLGIGDGDRLAVGIAIGDVADGDFLRIERAAAGDPVVQIPGKYSLVERHALQLFAVAQRPKRRVSDLHCRPVPIHETTPPIFANSLALLTATKALDARPASISNLETLFQYMKR